MAFIVGTSSFLPNQPVFNDQIEFVLGQVGARPSRARAVILRNNGIKRRFYAIDPVTSLATHTNAKLASEAVRALEDEQFSMAELASLVVGTSIADQIAPGHGVMVHGELGGHSYEVVSTSGICLAGISALKYAWLSVLSGNSDNAIACASENSSALLHARNFAAESEVRINALKQHPEIAFEKDFLRWMLSDGAGAVLLRNRPRRYGLSLRVDWIDLTSHANVLPTCMYHGATQHADGSLQGWAAHPQSQWLPQSVFSLKQDVRLLNENIVDHTLTQPLRDIIVKRSLQSRAIDWFLPHISSEYFRKPVANALDSLDFSIAQERWFTNLSTMGNTGSASFYIMLDELFRSGSLQLGQRLLGFVPESGRFSSGFVHLTVVDGGQDSYA
jgi:3-oxoacyl-[acyl-carrier-protein] synthase-3